MKLPCARCGKLTDAFRHFMPWCGCPTERFKTQWKVLAELAPIDGISLTEHLTRFTSALPKSVSLIKPSIRHHILEAVPTARIESTTKLYKSYAAKYPSIKEPSYAKLLLAMPEDIHIVYMPVFTWSQQRTHLIWIRKY